MEGMVKDERRFLAGERGSDERREEGQKNTYLL